MARAHKVDTQKDAMQARRKVAGLWLREKREAAALSQRDLAQAVGFEYYTFISQIEAGRGKVPSERYKRYADALGVEPREFAVVMLRFNDPFTYDLIFGSGEDEQQHDDDGLTIARIDDRLRRLEQKLLR